MPWNTVDFGGYTGVKTENTQSAKICLNFNFRGGGRGALLSEIPQRGSLENLDTNLLFEVSVQKPACASQIVSHILRTWRLIMKVDNILKKVTGISKQMTSILIEFFSEIIGAWSTNLSNFRFWRQTNPVPLLVQSTESFT